MALKSTRVIFVNDSDFELVRVGEANLEWGDWTEDKEPPEKIPKVTGGVEEFLPNESAVNWQSESNEILGVSTTGTEGNVTYQFDEEIEGGDKPVRDKPKIEIYWDNPLVSDGSTRYGTIKIFGKEAYAFKKEEDDTNSIHTEFTNALDGGHFFDLMISGGEETDQGLVNTSGFLTIPFQLPGTFGNVTVGFPIGGKYNKLWIGVTVRARKMNRDMSDTTMKKVLKKTHLDSSESISAVFEQVSQWIGHKPTVREFMVRFG